MLDIYKIKNSNVLVRVCYDLSNNHDISRISDSKKTIQLLLKGGNKVILISHWGRPEGKTNKQNSFKNLLQIIEKELESNLEFLNQYQNSYSEIKKQITNSKNSLFILENSRFNPKENSSIDSERLALAKNYISLASYFIDEAFPVSHRQEVTNFDIKKLLPSFLGLSYETEIDNLKKIKTNPEKPFLVIMAGAKLETKLPLITKMLPLADKIILAGKLCFTFIQAAKELNLIKYASVDIGESEIEDSFLETAKSLLLQNPEKIVLPVDFIYGNEAGEVVNSSFKNKQAYDVGEKSLVNFTKILSTAKTIFWNGTLGYYEKNPFDKGTTELANFVGTLKNTFKVVGGGDTHSALSKETLSKFNFISMGGGATLEYLSK